MCSAKKAKKEHELIERYIKSNNYCAAMIYVDKLLSHNPNDFKCLVYRSKCEMANQQFQDAEQTLTLAMSLQPEKPLPALAFVSLSDKCQVDEQRLCTALTLMRKFSLANEDSEKYQSYSLRLLKLLISISAPVDEIRQVFDQLQHVSKEDNFSMLMSFYERNALLSSEEEDFVFNCLHERILHISGKLEVDPAALDMYKKFCDLGYKTEKLAQLFDISNTIFKTSPEAWILHGELIFLIEMEFVSKLVENFEIPQLDDNSLNMLSILANLPDDGESVKPTIRNIATALLYFSSTADTSDLTNYICEFKLNQNKLIKTSSLVPEDLFLRIIILYLMTVSKTRIDSSVVKLDSVRLQLNESNRVPVNLKSKLFVLLDLCEMVALASLSKKFYGSKIVHLAELLEKRMAQSEPQVITSERVKEKVFSLKGEALLMCKRYDECEALLLKISESSHRFWYLKAFLKYKTLKNDSTEQVVDCLDKSLDMESNFEGLCLKMFIMLKRFKTAVGDLGGSGSDGDMLDEKRAVLDSCLESIELAEKLEPFSCETSFLYGLCFYQSEFYEDALKALSSCFQSNPLHLKSIKASCSILFEAEQYEAAIEVYRSNLSVFDSQLKFKLWLRLAVQLFSNDQHILCVECISQCRTYDRGNYLSWLLIAVVFYKCASYQSSHSCAMEALKLMQRDPLFLPDTYQSNIELQTGAFIAASSKLNLGHLCPAKDNFSTCLSITKHNLLFVCEKVVALSSLSRRHLNGCNKKEALESLQAALSLGFEASKRFPTEPLSWKVLADSLIIAKYCAGSIQFEIPGYVLGKLSRTIRVYRSTCMRIGLQCLRNVVATSTNYDSSFNWRALSRCCFELKSEPFLGLSLLYAKVAVSLADKDPDLWMFLGSLASSNEIADYKLAQHCFVTAFHLDENNLKALSCLAMLYFKIGRVQSAQTLFRFIGNLEPSNFLNVFYKQIHSSNSDVTSASVSAKFVLSAIERLEQEPLLSQSLLLAKYIVTSHEGFHISTWSKVSNALLKYSKVGVSRGWELDFFLGALHEKTELYAIAFHYYQLAVESCRVDQGRQLIGSSLIRLLAKLNVKMDVTANVNSADQLFRLLKLSEQKAVDFLNMCSMLCETKSVHNCAQYLRSLESLCKLSLSSYEKQWVVEMKRAETKAKRVRIDGRSGEAHITFLQKSFFESLDSKYLFRLFLELVKSRKFAEAASMRAKFEAIQEENSVQSQICVAICEIIDALRNGTQPAIVLSQKLVHSFPWIKSTHTLLLVVLNHISNRSEESIVGKTFESIIPG